MLAAGQTPQSVVVFSKKPQSFTVIVRDAERAGIYAEGRNSVLKRSKFGDGIAIEVLPVQPASVTARPGSTSAPKSTTARPVSTSAAYRNRY